MMTRYRPEAARPQNRGRPRGKKVVRGRVDHSPEERWRVVRRKDGGKGEYLKEGPEEGEREGWS